MADVLKGLPERIIQAAADEPAVYQWSSATTFAMAAGRSVRLRVAETVAVDGSWCLPLYVEIRRNGESWHADGRWQGKVAHVSPASASTSGSGSLNNAI